MIVAAGALTCIVSCFPYFLGYHDLILIISGDLDIVPVDPDTEAFLEDQAEMQ